MVRFYMTQPKVFGLDFRWLNSEHFQFYVMNGKLFREAAKSNSFLQQKYEWLKNNVFLGIEYNTGGFKTGIANNAVNNNPNAYDISSDFDYVWDRQFIKL